jgi:hypothetical protein
VKEPAVPAAIPAGVTSVVGTQLERLSQIAVELGDEALASDARAEYVRLMEARFFVSCLGQFKRGKSTLLNALVGQPVLPVGVVPVTSVVTILHYGDRPAATVRFSDGKTESVAVDAIAMFIDERQNPENRRHAAVVDVALPSSILRDGLCLVDTPGLGSVHAANTEATRAFVPRTDVALVVVGPDPPISGAELQLIEEVSPEAGELMVVLNKADQSSAEQLREVAEFTRATVEKALARPIQKILEISALERLNERRPTRDWLDLETHLKRLSSQKRQHLVGTAGLRSVRRLLGQIRRRCSCDVSLAHSFRRKSIDEPCQRAATGDAHQAGEVELSPEPKADLWRQILSVHVARVRGHTRDVLVGEPHESIGRATIQGARHGFDGSQPFVDGLHRKAVGLFDRLPAQRGSRGTVPGNPVPQLSLRLREGRSEELPPMLFELPPKVRLDGVEEETQIDQ